jgi:hypothetical protein
MDNPQLTPTPTSPASTVSQPQALLEDPDKALAIVSLAMYAVLPIPPISLILALIALRSSKRRGYKNTLAKVTVIISIIATILVAAVIALMIFAGAFSNDDIEVDTNDQFLDSQVLST